MFKKIAPDKWRHIYVGIALGILFQALAFWFVPQQLFMGTVIVLLIIIAISYGFELFSKITGMGVYDIWDAVASIVGGLIGMAVVGLIYWLQ
jgi:glycopeptide antibiotics resistance protein